MEAVKIILQYLNRLKDWGITYSSQEKLFIERYLNFNQAGNKKS